MILYTAEQIYIKIVELMSEDRICSISELIEKTKIESGLLVEILHELESRGLIRKTSLNDILVLK